MSKLNISDLAGSDFFTSEENLLTELNTEDTKYIIGGTGHKGGKGRGGSGKGRGGSGKGRGGSGKGRGGSSKGRGFGGGSSGGSCGFYCNPYCRT